MKPGNASRPTDPATGATPRVGRAVLLSVAAIALVFGTAEVVERTLLRGAGPAAVGALHAARGLAASVGAAFAVGWALLRASPPLFGAAAGAGQDAEAGSVATEDPPEHFAAWFVRMRWIAVAVATALVVVAVHVLALLPAETWWPLALVLSSLAACNLGWTFLLRRPGWAGPTLRAQIALDLVALTLLLHWSGGAENPLASIAVFHVIIAGIILPRIECHLVAALAAALVAALGWAELGGALPHFPLGLHAAADSLARRPMALGTWTAMQVAVLFGVAHFTASLAEHARRNRRRLAAMADRALGERQLLERALETAGTGLRVVGRDLVPLWQSGLWSEWFAPGPGSTAADQAARRTFDDGAVRVSERTLRGRPGLPGTNGPPVARTFRVTTAPVVGAGGEVRRVAELAQDVTEQRRTQAEMVRAGKLVAVGEMAAVVAHEINNPIAILGAKAQLLLSGRREEMSARVAGEVQKMVDLAERVSSIAQGLLSACRPARGARRPIDLRAPVRRVLGLVGAERERRGVEVDDRLREALPVEANASEMEQVFMNLLLNSLHAMPEGGRLVVAPGDAERPLADGRAAASVVVEDTGIGIAPDDVDRVWEPFFTTKGEGQGTGLGLSICLAVVQAHGGTIDIESEPGRGTRVTVRLPRAEPPAREEADRAEPAHPGG